MSAELFVEAVDTAIRIGWALAGWVVFAGVVASMLTLAAIACGAWGVRAVADRMRTPEPPRRHVPRWAHARPLEPTGGRETVPDRSTNFLYTRKDPS